MIKYLLPETGNFYKANLHCHTTFSDGKLTPAEVKAHYVEKGYSIVAYTDHEVLVRHDELNDENFIAMSGTELSVGEPTDEARPRYNRNAHIGYISLTQEPPMLPLCKDPAKLPERYHPHRDAAMFDPAADYERVFTVEGVSEMMKIGRDCGYFVTYNHPVWSLATEADYTGYTGMHAMEIFNNTCILGGYDDHVPQIYDAMLRAGREIFCTATDDNHSPYAIGGGWINIKAPSLTYENIAAALLAGDFYASTGPEIYALWLEDDGEEGALRVHIRCSESKCIQFGTARRRSGLKRAGSEPLCEAAFDVEALDGYFRLTVWDAEGNYAHTNAYFTEKWL